MTYVQFDVPIENLVQIIIFSFAFNNKYKAQFCDKIYTMMALCTILQNTNKHAHCTYGQTKIYVIHCTCKFNLFLKQKKKFTLQQYVHRFLFIDFVLLKFFFFFVCDLYKANWQIQICATTKKKRCRNCAQALT